MSSPRASPAPAEPSAAEDARFAVVVLTAMNLLNYVDRYVPSAVKELFKVDLGLTDAQTSWPLTAFILVYMLASPVFGGLADRAPRKALIAAGVALWSLATAGAALAAGFWSFLAARALVGVGEAAYATLAPPLLADFYPPERRNRVLTVFYVAIPVGSALGFAVGGWAGAMWGWRAAFLVCGLPGLIAALAALRIRDPGHGPPAGAGARVPTAASPAAVSWPTAVRRLLATPSYVVAVAGYTLVTFAAGGMADWFPTWLARYRAMDLEEAGTVVGAVTVVGGLFGTACGGWLADRLVGRTKNPYLALAAGSMLPASALAALALAAPNGAPVIACLLAAQFFLWFYNGPINALIVNAVGTELRPRAFALSILCIHLFGDAISPPIIGAISDRTGELTHGVLLVPVFLALGAAVWAVGWRRLSAAVEAG